MSGKKLRLAMLGAGSGFVLSIAREVAAHEIFEGATLVLMDPDADRLAAAEKAVEDLGKGRPRNVGLECSTSREKALAGCDYVITSCEKNRYPNWVRDLRIPERHGVHQVKGENGGPGGLIHGMRNIGMFMGILADMERLCPDAWLLNFTNPMSILCTYFKNYSKTKALGFCHQVHGSMGVVAEMLGLEPGGLEVVAAGVNHLSWLFDIRLKGGRKSFMPEFLEKVRESKHWKAREPNVPPQNFTLELLETFGMYPIGYDDHIVEYVPFFWQRDEWEGRGVESLAPVYEKLAARKSHVLEWMRLLGKDYEKPPFPRDANHPYYEEAPCRAIVALETNTPTYFDAINIRNNGAVPNLPQDAILDVPAVAVGGAVRSVHVGELPAGPVEICRRQIALHEMISRAAHEGDDSLAVQALCLDPYVRSVTQAKAIWADFRREYRDDLPPAFRAG